MNVEDAPHIKRQLQRQAFDIAQRGRFGLLDSASTEALLRSTCWPQLNTNKVTWRNV
jgi:hypothetical protein